METNIILSFGKHDGLIFFMEQFAKYLEAKKVNYLVVDFTNPQSYGSEEVEKFVNQSNVVMFTFNNVGIKFSYNNGENVWKYRNIPVFDYIVDHPRNFDDSMENPPCDLYVFTLDKDHKKFIERFYPKVKNVYFSPNGGVDMNSYLPFSKRPIDVIYMENASLK